MAAPVLDLTTPAPAATGAGTAAAPPTLDLTSPKPPLDLKGQGPSLVKTSPDDHHNAYQTLLKYAEATDPWPLKIGDYAADFASRVPEGLGHLPEDLQGQLEGVKESLGRGEAQILHPQQQSDDAKDTGGVGFMQAQTGIRPRMDQPDPVATVVKGVGNVIGAGAQAAWPSAELKSTVSRPLAQTLNTDLEKTDLAVNLATAAPDAVNLATKIPAAVRAVKSLVTGAEKVGAMADAVGEVLNPQYANKDRERAATAFAGASSDYKRKQNLLTYHDITQKTLDVFSKMPDQANLAIISAIQRGDDVADAAVKPLVQAMRSVLDSRAKELVGFGALTRKNFIEHYFPNMFEDQDAAKTFLGQAASKLESTPGFLRSRNYDYFEDGIKAGLKPVTTNPALLTLIRTRQVDQYIQRLTILRNLKDMGFVRYVKYGEDTAGFSPLEDSAFGHAFEEEVPLQKRPQPPQPVTVKTGDAKTVIPRRLALESTFKEVEGLIKKHGDAPAYAIHREVSPQEWLPYRVLKDHFDELSPTAKKVLGRIPNAKITGSKLRDLAQELEGLGTKESRAALGRVFANKRVKAAEDTGAGRWMIHDDARRLADRHFSGGLFERNDWIGKAARTDRLINNGLSQMQLGFSLFHPRFIFFDTSISATATGVERIVRGDFAGAAKSMASGLSHTVMPKRVLEGALLKKRYMGNDLDVVAKMFGYKASEVDEVLGQMLKGDFSPMRPEVYSNHVQTWREYWKQGKHLKGALGALSTTLDHLSYPVFGWLVPNAKTGVVYNMAQDWLKANPEATFEDVSTNMRKIIDSVDNRLGEMDLDRRFWDKTFKDTMLLSQRAVGWNYGTVDEIGGGAADLRHFLATGKVSHKLAYTLALTLHTALYGSVLTYLATGKGPQELKDYFFPPDGKGARISLPTYAKDVYEWTHRPGTTLVNKAAPDIEMATELYHNQDFYGAFIIDPRLHIPNSGRDDIHGFRQLTQYLGDFVEPFGIQGYERKEKGKHTALGYLESPEFRGSMPAPSWVNQTPEQAAAEEIRKNRKGVKEEYLEGRPP